MGLHGEGRGKVTAALTTTGAHSKDRVRPFQVQKNKIKSNEHKSQHRKFQLDVQKKVNLEGS